MSGISGVKKAVSFLEKLIGVCYNTFEPPDRPSQAPPPDRMARIDF